MTDTDLRSLRVPMFCPVCGGMMFGSKCNQTYYDWGCCATCHVMFVEDREQRWRDGWRPTEADISEMRSSLRGS